ncbi:MAG: cell division protein FtsA [Patescibacteria group bacterium]|nr:cell division protein FtsA [Patescibacteria group bacterium]
MSKDQFVVALDIGSSKISCVVANLDGSRISVIGAHTGESKGIKSGVVNNIDKAVSSINDVINKAEMMSGQAISRVVVTISGTHIESLNSRGVVAVSGQNSEINADDISRVNDAAQALSLPSSREIVHVLPREYVVDRQKGISDPSGMTGIRLEVEANIIHGSTTAIKNLVKCVQQIGIEVDQLAYSGLSSAEAVLTDTEKELGTILIDIGGGTMDLIIYSSGRPAYSAVLPIGGQDITNDLAIGLRALLEDAEKVKVRLSDYEEFSSKAVIIDKNGREAKIPKGELYVGDLNFGMDSVPISVLNEIIYKRLEEAFKFVKIYVKKAGFADKLPAGVVLTGGTSMIPGIENIAEDIFRLPVRVGKPSGIIGLADQIQTPSHSAVIGALKYVSSTIQESGRTNGRRNGTIMGINERIKSFFKSFLP